MERMENNVFDCALVLEGGGMRCAYTAGLITVLVEEGIFFDYVCGISAGSSSTVNYLSRDLERIRYAFVDVADDPKVGGPRSFVTGKGFFNADYLYGENAVSGPVPYDWEAFLANPARMRIQSFERDTGRTVTWGREDIHQIQDLLDRVRASSTLPRMMPPIEVDGHVMVDGGMGLGAGLPTHLAEQDGFGKFFVIATHTRGWRRPELTKGERATATRLFKAYPHLRNALLTRPTRYNMALDHLLELEASGAAYVVWPDEMPIENSTLDRDKLQVAFAMGHRQGLRELPRWREFLGL